MNKTLFKTQSVKSKKLNSATPNAAGGVSYDLSAEQALSQYAVTCCFGGTYYVNATEQIQKVGELVKKVRPELIAKIAVYSRESGNMKDMPSYLLAYLFSIGENELFTKIFNRVIVNSKMLCNFVQIIRSGVLGRKSFGTVGKNAIRAWLLARSPEQLFKDSVGHSKPSLVDIIKMVRPKFPDSHRDVTRYLFGRKYSVENLPTLVQNFVSLKNGGQASPKGLDFRLLSNLTLDTAQWGEVAKGMTWNALRMNLNNLQKHGVFNTSTTLDIAKKLANKESVKKYNAFPYQLLNTYKNIGAVPDKIKNAIEQALEFATENVPNMGKVAVCMDVSGSMNSSVTGGYSYSGNGVTCVDVAALVSSCILRTADETLVLPFDTEVKHITVNKYDSVLTNSRKLTINGGGTDCGCAMKHLVNTGWQGDLVFFVSDNMSWADFHGSYRTSMAENWLKLKRANPKCKLVLLDVTPNHQSQMFEDKDVLHVAGFSDSVFTVVEAFLSDKQNFVKFIESVSLDNVKGQENGEDD